MPRTFMSGLDVQAQRGMRPWGRGRLALLTHQSAIASDGRHLLELLEMEGLRPAVVFSPEHGLWATHQDMEAVESMQDPMFSYPVLSLYGRDAVSLAPHRDWLEGIDRLVVDLQDVGARYYTFAATLAKSLRVAAQTGTTVTLLDRPNPIGIIKCEGSPQLPDYCSFVGELQLPHRHGLTMAEMARWIVREEKLDVDLELVPMKNWNGRGWPTSAPWVPPSPNMPTLSTALVYPGMCLLEGTNLSEGRGTTTPFLVFGAPYMDGRAVAHALRVLGANKGCIFIPTIFRPMFGKWGGHLCQGVRIHVTDPEAFCPLTLGTAVLQVAWDLYPADFAWRTETYEFENDRLAVDLLFGDPAIRAAIECSAPFEGTVDKLGLRLDDYLEKREGILIYRRRSPK